MASKIMQQLNNNQNIEECTSLLSPLYNLSFFYSTAKNLQLMWFTFYGYVLSSPRRSSSPSKFSCSSSASFLESKVHSDSSSPNISSEKSKPKPKTSSEGPAWSSIFLRTDATERTMKKRRSRFSAYPGILRIY